MAGLAAGLVYATVRPMAGRYPPIAIVAVAATLMVLLLSKPGAGGSAPGLSYVRTPPADLTGAGRAAFVLSLLAAALAVSHLLALRRLDRRVDLRRR